MSIVVFAGPTIRPDAVASIARAIDPDIELEGFADHPDPCEAG